MAYIKDRLRESSYIFIIYFIVGSMLSVVLGLFAYLMILVWANFYIKNPALVYVITQSTLRLVIVAISETLFIWVVLKVILTDNGDTILIEVIKNIEKEKEAKLVGEYYYNIKISDISVHAEADLKVESIGMLKELNKMPRGYIKIDASNYKDICFTGDLVFSSAIPNDAEDLTLHVKQYSYRGLKLIGSHVINKFWIEELQDKPETVNLITNTYIQRLFDRKVYDYPLSLASDLKEGLSKSKISLVIIAFSMSIIIGIYGFYRGASTREFLNNFEIVSTEKGISIQTDDRLTYNKYHIYVQDAIAMLPEPIVHEFIGDGWTLVFTDNDLASYPIISTAIDENTVSGCTFPFYKLIVIQLPDRNNIETSQYFFETIVHEFGHYIALKTNALSEEWDNIYTMEKLGYPNSYALTNPSEGFACCFANYILDENRLKEGSPKTYNYINNTIQNYISK